MDVALAQLIEAFYQASDTRERIDLVRQLARAMRERDQLLPDEVIRALVDALNGGGKPARSHPVDEAPGPRICRFCLGPLTNGSSFCSDACARGHARLMPLAGVESADTALDYRLSHKRPRRGRHPIRPALGF